MAFEIVILPRIDVTIIAVTAGDASLVIVSPVENSPVVVRAHEL